MAVKFLICENCKQVVAAFDPTDVSIPVNGGMFVSQYQDRGGRAPWAPFVEAEWMRCPRCPKRVFHDPRPLYLTVSDTIDGLNPYFLDLRVSTGGDDNGRDQHPDPARRK